MESKLNIPYIPEATDAAMLAVPAAPVACCNWPDDYPYAPKVEVRVAHTGDRLVLRYDVTEDVVGAAVMADNGEVWTDSCVEFFISLDGTTYYNFECNCIGSLLISYRAPGAEPVHAQADVLDTVVRRGSLPHQAFAERRGPEHWSMTLEIPATALFKHQLADWRGVHATANFYKCGDNLSKPHFLSWAPIPHPTPCFHLPQHFGEVVMGD